MKITVEDFKEYVAGHLMAGEDNNLGAYNIEQALHNALVNIDHDQDGIEAVTERRRLYESERKKKMVGITSQNTHAVVHESRKGENEGVVFVGTYQECIEYCQSQDYPEEFCYPEENTYGDEEETLEIQKLP